MARIVDRTKSEVIAAAIAAAGEAMEPRAKGYLHLVQLGTDIGRVARAILQELEKDDNAR